jgi:monovalent cation:H+ antiporter-2, CPA2 family
MAHASVVLAIAVALLLAAALGWVARRLGLPAVIGYLAAGLAISPFTPGYVADRGQIQLLADIGVVLLLFEVGIEVDVVRLQREHGRLLWAAPVQLVVTALVAGLALATTGLSPLGSALIGLAVAMSSSVVIVNIAHSRRRTTDPATEATPLDGGRPGEPASGAQYMNTVSDGNAKSKAPGGRIAFGA